MARRKNTKELIFQIIKKHPDGLTIQQIAKLANVSRITATIYVHELLGEGKIKERKIGVYRLIFPKESFIEEVTDEELLKKLRRALK